MTYYPVSTRVNSVRNDDAKLIARVEEGEPHAAHAEPGAAAGVTGAGFAVLVRNHGTAGRLATSDRQPLPRSMDKFPDDIYTEAEADSDMLANLGPLAAMAGVWTSTRGLDVAPKADGPETQAFIENYTLQPIDAQVNGPQLFYGLRYHTQIFKPDDPETFHDQVGSWLWEPATGERP